MMTKSIGRRRHRTTTGSSGTSGIIPVHPRVIERHSILANTYRVDVPHLPTAFSGLRVIHLSDLHHGSFMSLSRVAHIIRRANSLGGDVILCTGDYVHQRRSARQIDAVWPILSQLSAPLGTYSVLGNHDHWADGARSQHWLTKSGQDLRHRVISIEKNGRRIWLVGAGDLWEDHRDLDALLSLVPQSDCRIVLAHNPDTADTSFSERVDLMVSGHTHGGQVDIPLLGPPHLPVRNKTYTSGLKVSPRGLQVFISKGIGWACFPIRFNCFPEIAVLELFPA
jgi:uncharacterized protein